MKHLYLAGLLLTACRFACAGEADVLAADVSCSSDTVCSFSVTLQHEDEGWDHFANRWEILDSNGNVIDVRELAHPHVNEQPFTRSLGNVKVPAGLSEVVIRAHDSVHLYGGKQLIVELPR